MTAQPTSPPVGLDYLLFDPTPFAFPRPVVPLLAPLQTRDLRWRPTRRPAWAANGRLYARARYALFDAFRLSGVGPGGGLLAPALHCRTMLDPALALGAPVQLFALRPDLSPDMADVERQLRQASVPVKAVLMTHFFGLAQDLAPLAALCRQWGAALVEDCAHALPLQSAQVGLDPADQNGAAGQMGRTGQWCVASPYKFFACEDGGALWSGSGQALPDLPALQRPGLRRQWQQWRLLRARARVPAQPPRAALDLGLSLPQSNALASASRQQGVSPDFDLRSTRLACSPLSRCIIDHTDIAGLLRRRRDNFSAWHQALQGSIDLQTPWTRLGPHDTPYAFPVLLNAQPASRFAALKRAGLPIWRWDSLAASDCATSAAYRQRLLQLPCHQALTATQMAWMIDTLRQVVATPVQATSP